MTRKIMIGIFILMLVLCSAPYFCGIVAKRRLEHYLSELSVDPLININLEAYQQGWFHSSAKIGIEFKDTASRKHYRRYQSAMGQPEIPWPHIIINESITHGPLFFTQVADSKRLKMGIAYIEHTPEWNDAFQSMVQIAIGRKLEFSGQTIIGFNSYLTVMNTPGFEFVLGPREIKWAGADLAFYTNYQFDVSTLNMDLSPISLAVHEQEISTSEMLIRCALRKNKIGLWLGEQSLSIPQIHYNTKNRLDEFSLEGLKLSIISDGVDELGKFNYSLALDKLLLLQTNYGPGQVTVTIDKLYLPAIKTFKDQTFQSTVGSSGRLTEQMMNQFVMNVFSRGIDMQVHVNKLNLPQGIVQLDANLKVPSLLDKVETNTAISLNQQQRDMRLWALKIIQQAQFELTAKIPVKLTVTLLKQLAKSDSRETEQDIQQDLQNLVNQSYIRIQDEDYLINVKYEQGKLSVGQQSIPLPTFK